MISRRAFLGAAASNTFILSSPSITWAAGGVPVPNSKQFESGDFLWPKKPGTFVPYEAGPPRLPDFDEQKWVQDRNQFVANVQTKAPHFTSAAIERIRNLSYREFYAQYVGAQKPSAPGVYSVGGGLYVGHVGIVEIDETGKIWVIEALLDRGVVRRTYADWVAERSGQMIWLGRVNKLTKRARVKIPLEAKKHLGKPYDFWNFDLNDDSGFYCSKLAWMAIFRTANFAIDGITSPKRFFWFSPKQLLYTKRMGRLFDPGSYKFS